MNAVQTCRLKAKLTGAISLPWVYLIGLIAIGFALSAPAAAEQVVVRINSAQSAITENPVRVGDVASVEGGTATDRRLISRLDLDSVEDGKPCLVSQRQINTRLLLAGFSRSEFQILGPTVTSVVSTSPDAQSHQLAAILEAQLGRQFGIDPKRIDIRLDNTTQVESFLNQFMLSAETIGLSPKNELPIGRTRLQLECIAKGSTQTRVPHQVWLDATVGLSMRVAVASTPITRGAAISPGMVQMVDRTVTTRADYVDAETVTGKTTSRYIAQGTILLASHLIATRRGQDQPIVKRNDLIDVVIRAGAGEIRLKNARAMEPGRAGETIEVLNPKSGKRFNAEVVSENVATVAPTWQRRLVR
ncbi:flagellar basal body P-ring formation chaperone FlgA [Roseiconus lacunae]|uniref:Flagellar basal body P-ring formation chaperone FlgA n=1 Tax=Roseiconus lacunae TaxID=2605694 RepID=A0ABT7PKF2_9BACT|nr:flagellar basal body P-ring formation chaperone FlgA [Roseiconus lacunae]MDM4016766.1 flagellar basal body P-ring formation chaperone FlgA [Roseiconus lacunae]